MKLAAVASFLRSSTGAAMLLLLPLLLIGWAEEAVANPFHRVLSPVLQNEETYQNVEKVAREAQQAQDDPSIRLLPSIKTNQEHMKICCLHANILDFYLNNVLPHHGNENRHIHRLKVDLGRISQDLQTHGCNVTHYRDHQHTLEFQKRFHKMDSKQRLNKAVSEVDILFSCLQDFCVYSPNTADATADVTADVTAVADADADAN